MTKKVSRRDFIRASAAAGAAGLVAPSVIETLGAAPQGSIASTRPLTSFDAQAREVLSRMTLEEKIGQMTQPEQDALKELEDIRTYFVGSLLSGGNSDPKKGGAPDNSLQAWTDMYDRYQQVAVKTRLGIPILYGADAVHGHNNVLGAVIFPHNVGLGCTRNARLVEQAARVTAEEVRATGIQWTFAPCVTVPRDERWGRAYEGFGESPELAATLGAAAVRGLQGRNLSDPLSVLACAKHYVGDGGTVMGTGSFGTADGKAPLLDQGDTRLSERDLRRIHMPGYPATIKEGVGTIMPSYSSWNGKKVSGDKYLLTDVLKQELGFQGFLISDYNAIDQITKDYKEAIAVSINAGMDMVMVPHRYREFFDLLRANVKEGRVPQSRIDDAVMRILRVKFAMGMMDKDRSQLADRRLHSTFGSAAHRQVARECVRQSLVLLKNTRRALPLRKTAARIHVAGKAADDIGNQCGGWTIDWQGKSGDVTPGGTTILQAIQNTVSKQTKVTFSKDGTGASGADVGVVVIGETPYAEGVGDRQELNLAPEDVAAVENMKRAGIPVVAVLVSGRPLVIDAVLPKCDAFVAAWLPGTEGQGVADVLFGDYKPTGKLSFSWPRTNAQLPINVGDRGYNPLFKYGFGLTY
ncbi:MAG TPA: glycoside hydrolase family 3 N-terminal domain-containing protein [Pyrinomonadaceae bacterium]|jgi:beta-glucosidase|nr:glycoside hydrolase family 3 N-terminal domain-containing protein [Pyrinomonadaceae bacterium]